MMHTRPQGACGGLSPLHRMGAEPVGVKGTGKEVLALEKEKWLDGDGPGSWMMVFLMDGASVSSSGSSGTVPLQWHGELLSTLLAWFVTVQDTIPKSGLGAALHLETTCIWGPLAWGL